MPSITIIIVLLLLLLMDIFPIKKIGPHDILLAIRIGGLTSPAMGLGHLKETQIQPVEALRFPQRV